MKNLFRKTFAIFGILALSASWLLIPAQTANSAMDCDANAVVYCGASTASELYRKVTNGTGKKYQSGKELTWLFNHYGIPTSQLNDRHLGTGYVTRTNQVWYKGKRVDRGGVYTMGRSHMPGSTDAPNIYYPLWHRPPSVSFRSASIPAFVKMNPDGTFAYAIIKSCGNIVPGIKYVEPRYKLTVWKFNDLNRNGRRESNEPMLPNWTFDIKSNNGYSSPATTSSNGGITITRLKKGTYTITERQQTGWENTTDLRQNVVITNANRSVYFGNARVRPQLYSLEIRKFEDENRDGDRDFGEEYLPGWEFRVQGIDQNNSDFDYMARTGTTGTVRVPGLKAGNYRITEVSQPGWEAITNPMQVIEFTNQNRTIEFGNYQEDPRVQLRVVKFHDRDGDTVIDGNEEGLSGWRFRVSGPNGFEQIITTDFSGDYTLTNLEPGEYTVTEILRDGWVNTTNLSLSREITEDPTTQVFIFGNRQTEDPETPGGGDLPSSGPMEAAAAAFGSMSLSGGALAWLRSKKNLLSAFKK